MDIAGRGLQFSLQSLPVTTNIFRSHAATVGHVDADRYLASNDSAVSASCSFATATCEYLVGLPLR